MYSSNVVRLVFLDPSTRLRFLSISLLVLCTLSLQFYPLFAPVLPAHLLLGAACSKTREI